MQEMITSGIIVIRQYIMSEQERDTENFFFLLKNFENVKKLIKFKLRTLIYNNCLSTA